MSDFEREGIRQEDMNTVWYFDTSVVMPTQKIMTLHPSVVGTDGIPVPEDAIKQVNTHWETLGNEKPNVTWEEILAEIEALPADAEMNPLIEYATSLLDEALELMKKKNHDYTINGDPLSNFRLIEKYGIARTEDGIFMRLLDKISRLANGLTGEYEVTDETMHDTIVDAINYLIILGYAIEKDKGD